MEFELNLPNRVVFGSGALERLGQAVKGLGKRAMIVTGRGGPEAGGVMRIANSYNTEYSLFEVRGEPTVEVVIAAVRQLHEDRAEMVIAFGGGSAIDTAKAAACLAANPGETTDYLEVIGLGKSLLNPGLPVIAIPTTAGTGAEVTRNAVLGVPEKRIKVSLRSPLLLPKLALVDPDLTHSLPPHVTASTGMDALAQVLEPFLSKRANAMTDLFCREGMRRISRSIVKAYHNGDDSSARNDMSFGSLLGGLALANAGLGAVHGFAGVIGGMTGAPHGVICACLLPEVVKANATAIERTALPEDLQARFREAAELITGRAGAAASDLSEHLAMLCDELHIPRLRELGIDPGDIRLICERSKEASSMKANPVQFNLEELEQILHRSW